MPCHALAFVVVKASTNHGLLWCCSYPQASRDPRPQRSGATHVSSLPEASWLIALLVVHRWRQFLFLPFNPLKLLARFPRVLWLLGMCLVMVLLHVGWMHPLTHTLDAKRGTNQAGRPAIPQNQMAVTHLAASGSMINLQPRG